MISHRVARFLEREGIFERDEENSYLNLEGQDEEPIQLIAGTCHDLRIDAEPGRLSEDLYARINLWTFHLPGLVDRSEDIEPNLEYELECRPTAEISGKVRFELGESLHRTNSTDTDSILLL